jgi:hypothetical protein
MLIISAVSYLKKLDSTKLCISSKRSPSIFGLRS